MESIQQFPNIPDEILVNIFSILLIKSRSRFKCVCKPWCCTISSNLPNGRHRAIIMLWRTASNIKSLHFIDDEAPFGQELSQPWKSKGSHFYGRPIFFAGSCNGLLLIGLDNDLCLWNPLTKYFQKVLQLDRLVEEGYRITSGFCYDPSIDDYKAVIGLAHQTPSYGGEFVIFATFKRKRWILINFPYNIRSAYGGPVVNGRLHWRVTETIDNPFFAPHKIVYFDPSTDEFKEVPIPYPKYRDVSTVMGLGVLSGCLCMTRWDNETAFEGNIEVLVMKEYGVKESWTNIFTVSNSNLEVKHFGDLMPLFLTKNGDVLMVIDRQILLAHNLKENSQRNIQIPNIDHYYYIQAVTFVESGVSPTCYHWNRRRHRRCGKEIKRRQE